MPVRPPAVVSRLLAAASGAFVSGMTGSAEALLSLPVTGRVGEAVLVLGL